MNVTPRNATTFTGHLYSLMASASSPDTRSYSFFVSVGGKGFVIMFSFSQRQVVFALYFEKTVYFKIYSSIVFCRPLKWDSMETASPTQEHGLEGIGTVFQLLAWGYLTR